MKHDYYLFMNHDEEIQVQVVSMIGYNLLRKSFLILLPYFYFH